MYVDKIKLINFRNYKDIEVNFTNGINMFVGYNAQGKTNLLEALYFTACGRSHRTNKDKELINWEAEECFIKTSVNKKINKNIDINISKEFKKSIKINNIPIKKLGELMGNLNVVMFSPEDLKLVKEGPIEKRRFLDIGISQLKPNYFYNLQQYFKILHHRNALIKELKNNKSLLDTLSIWDNNLVEIGSQIMYYRNEHIKRISKYLEPIHKKISNEEISIIYTPSVSFKENDIGEIKKSFMDKLKKSFEKDIYSGITSIGPHRDKFEIFINSKDVKIYGSQGQQRTSVLSLKLAEIEIFKDELGEYPILLLDDVMSELDYKRQKFLFDNLKDMQIFITSTSKDIDTKRTASIYNVLSGQVTKEA